MLCIHIGMILVAQDRVSPFGNLRINACVPLPEAYRSLLRPSSPDDAKASINCCNWFMQTLIILGVYSTYLHALKIYLKLSKNKIISFLPSAAQSTLYKTRFIMVGPDGLEPSTPRLSSACSNQLSYEPIGNWQCSKDRRWWSRTDSNRRHPACKAGALPTELRPHEGKYLKRTYFLKFTLCDQLRPRLLELNF